MKYIANLLALIIWGAITITLVITLLGIIALFFFDDDESDSWFKIPMRCIENLK
jgi:hypothetical protein